MQMSCYAHSMRRRDFLAALPAGMGIALAGTEAQACLWDQDTLEQEAQGAPDVLETLIGGFARNPPSYYEMRLARVSGALPSSPDTLELYDDAAVAADRLGRHDEAIAWMADKRTRLEQIDLRRQPAAGAPNHWYRYHANLGTFHAHRWFSEGANMEAMDGLAQGRALIAQAIEDNPNAHFGREKYQLRLMDWLLSKPVMDEDNSHHLPKFIESETPEGGEHPRFVVWDNQTLAKQGLDDAIAGLCGLITLGAAWNSFDVTVTLNWLLAADGKQSLVRVAHNRCAEIVEAGGRSLVAGAPTGEALMHFALSGMVEDLDSVDAQYRELRAAAQTWSSARESYLMERLERGEHPDTHPDFWSRFEGDPSRMQLQGASVIDKADPARSGVGIAGGAVALGALGLVAWRKSRSQA